MLISTLIHTGPEQFRERKASLLSHRRDEPAASQSSIDLTDKDTKAGIGNLKKKKLLNFVPEKCVGIE